MTVYKLNDYINYNFLRIPKALFVKEEYKKLSSDAKLVYGLLLDRLSLSQRNGWINENDEIYLIYTREAISEDLNISYKKATKAFKELVAFKLIRDERPGQGRPNRIYIAKVEANINEAREYVAEENLRTAEMEYLGINEGINAVDNSNSEPPKGSIKKRNKRKSRTAKIEYQNPPKPPTNNTNFSYTDFSNTDNQSIDDSLLDAILEHCEIGLFDGETRKMLTNAIEQMFYSRSLAVCGSNIPGYKVRSRLCDLTHEMLESAVHALHQNKGSITRRTQYIMSVIYNSLFEDVNILHTDPYLNYMRGDAVCT